MQLAPDTLEVLQNYSQINPNLMIREGDELLIIAPNTSLIGKAKLSQSFDRTFGIYDLRKFLSCVGLSGDAPTIELGESSATIKGESGKIQFYYSDEQTLQTINKTPKMPAPVLTFTLRGAELDRLRKACSTLGHRLIGFTNDDEGFLVAKALDPKTSNSHVFTLKLQDKVDTDADFQFIFDVGNLTILPGDYKVELTGTKISQFTHLERPITYWVGTEKESYWKAKE